MSLALKITMTWERKCMWGREKIGVKFVWFTLMDFSLREVHCICVYRERERKKKSYLTIIS